MLFIVKLSLCDIFIWMISYDKRLFQKVKATTIQTLHMNNEFLKLVDYLQNRSLDIILLVC